MTNVNCDQLVDYLNGSLDEQQRQQFEQHLAECPECRDIVDMTGELPYLAEPVEPNTGMKARILDAVFEEEQKNEPTEVHTAVREAKTAPTAMPKRTFTSSKWTPLIAAGLLVSLLGNAYAFYELSDRPDAPESPAVAFETVDLQPSEAFEGIGTAAIVRDENALNLLVQADQLAPLSGGEVYQIWLLKDGEPIPAGAFTADEENEGAAFFSLEEDTEGWDTIAITLEPQRGNETPQGEVVLSAAIDPEA
ncbi:anti-sigma factor [Planococcus sp. ISL-109]|uniref:anti-sigma factor n=1 Tax=Planococcus sp. ISL-109 TaxID=2819166 RepID=UPI001BEB60DB|nr:anti-sigma factor [Planococcus sp. ISL-109]MBT2582796.1 anti-sigma factor [Planococcus sp. ISL-109]